jgi:hypothetical protein
MGQTHMPNQRFNLFHIDDQEHHLETLTVSAFMFDSDLSSLASREADQRLENSSLLQNGVLHVNSRSLVFDQEAKDNKLPHLTKFRFNSKFDFHVVSGEQLETVHSQVLESYTKHQHGRNSR